jgi:hypothetical protein
MDPWRCIDPLAALWRLLIANNRLNQTPIQPDFLFPRIDSFSAAFHLFISLVD